VALHGRERALTLTERGHHLLEAHRRDRDETREQAFYAGVSRPRELSRAGMRDRAGRRVKGSGARRLWVKLRRPGDGDLGGDVRVILQANYTGNLCGNHNMSLTESLLRLNSHLRERPSLPDVTLGMTSRAQELLREALTLPIAERADVAAELLASLDGAETDNPAEVEAAWASEIERRARRVMAGESAGVPWSDVRQRAEAELHKRR
jgi:putative addiction module component (TIGR02574 family)